jgi:hypothetical protein
VPTRTTLTLDDDVAAGLRRAARATGRPFRVIVNEALRSGLEAQRAPPPTPFKVLAADLGIRPGVDLDAIAELIDRVEGTEHR